MNFIYLFIYIYLFPAAQERVAGSLAPPRSALQGACVCMYACMYMYLCVYIYMYIYLFIYSHEFMYMYSCARTRGVSPRFSLVNAARCI